LKREIIITDDGSTTIFLPEWNECYHSTHGAVNESNHIFIEAGLKYVLSNQTDIRILEVGFGTGLNAFLTSVTAKHYTIYYIGLEPYPLNHDEIASLNYPESSGFKKSEDSFKRIHSSPWEKDCLITPNFTLCKTQQKIEEAILPENHFNLIYFDAFAPMVQPELWQKSIFEKLYRAMQSGGILVTYSCKGDVKRALKESGFAIEKLPGPTGKREFVRAKKSPVQNLER
jgi:tRNA U34 5-methylaminomethyl-2-thiouridine-forming methyltransferase MnmC